MQERKNVHWDSPQKGLRRCCAPRAGRAATGGVKQETKAEAFTQGCWTMVVPHWAGTSAVATWWQLEEQFESCQVGQRDQL